MKKWVLSILAVITCLFIGSTILVIMRVDIIKLGGIWKALLFSLYFYIGKSVYNYLKNKE